MFWNGYLWFWRSVVWFQLLLKECGLVSWPVDQFQLVLMCLEWFWLVLMGSDQRQLVLTGSSWLVCLDHSVCSAYQAILFFFFFFLHLKYESRLQNWTSCKEKNNAIYEQKTGSVLVLLSHSSLWEISNRRHLNAKCKCQTNLKITTDELLNCW